MNRKHKLPKNWTDEEKRVWAKEVGERIKEQMEERFGKRSQNKFAKLLGISQGTMSDIINGISTPHALTLLKIMHHTDMSIEYLLGGEYE